MTWVVTPILSFFFHQVSGAKLTPVGGQLCNLGDVVSIHSPTNLLPDGLKHIPGTDQLVLCKLVLCIVDFDAVDPAQLILEVFILMDG